MWKENWTNDESDGQKVKTENEHERFSCYFWQFWGFDKGIVEIWYYWIWLDVKDKGGSVEVYKNRKRKWKEFEALTRLWKVLKRKNIGWNFKTKLNEYQAKIDMTRKITDILTFSNKRYVCMWNISPNFKNNLKFFVSLIKLFGF